MEVPKECPQCGEADELGTIEVLHGWCAHIDGEPQGYTEVDWNSSTTVFVGCRNCGWMAAAE